MARICANSRIYQMRIMEVGASIAFKILPLADKQSIRNAASILKRTEGKHYTVNYDFEHQEMKVTRIK